MHPPLSVNDYIYALRILGYFRIHDDVGVLGIAQPTQLLQHTIPTFLAKASPIGPIPVLIKQASYPSNPLSFSPRQ